MKRTWAFSLLVGFLLALGLTVAAEAARVRVVHRGHRTRVTVRAGFPLHRRLPHVYVRAPRVAIRVTPRVFLPPLIFPAVVVAVPPALELREWRETEEVDDEWTEFTLNVDRHGKRMLLEITEGAARVSFVEVVFENGDAQVVDFDDKVRATGLYDLLDFADGRKVDHVRIVARAAKDESEIGVILLK